jgi:transposase InsO family protein
MRKPSFGPHGHPATFRVLPDSLGSQDSRVGTSRDDSPSLSDARRAGASNRPLDATLKVLYLQQINDSGRKIILSSGALARTPMDEGDNTARNRLSVLRLAERLGNASEACRRTGVDRTSFYQWKRRFAREGLPGLANRIPDRKQHPFRTPAGVERRIVELAISSPAHGCDRIARTLAKAGITVSGVTIQKILSKAKLGTYEMRAAALETRYAQASRKLSAEQIEFLERINPCFRERDLKVGAPGEVLCLGVFFLGRFEGPGAVYVHAIVDGFSSYAFANLSTITRIGPAIEALQDQTLPFFAEHRVAIRSVLSGRLSESDGVALDAYSGGRRIEHRPRDGSLGFIERFRRIAVNEFLRRPFVRRLSRAGLPRLQREFDDWLASYNEERPQEGYPNYGAIPRSIITQACKRG